MLNQYTYVCKFRRTTAKVIPRYTLLVIKSSWQSLGHDTPGPRPCLSSFFSCWFVLMEPASLVLRPFRYAHAREGKEGSGK